MATVLFLLFYISILINYFTIVLPRVVLSSIQCASAITNTHVAAFAVAQRLRFKARSGTQFGDTR
jgi:hypothetical protein